MRNDKALINIDDLIQPIRLANKSHARKYIFLYPITLGQTEHK